MSAVDIATIVAAIAAIAALVPVYYFVKGKRARPHKIDIDHKNAILAPVTCASNGYPRGKLALAFYGLKVVNSADTPVTLKSIHLQCKLDSNPLSEDSYAVITSNLSSGEQGFVVRLGPANVVLVGWENARTKLAALPTLQPGGVFAASALFILGDHTPGRAVESTQLVVEDYSGRRSIHAIEPKWIEAREQATFMNVPFTVVDEKVEWLT